MSLYVYNNSRTYFQYVYKLLSLIAEYSRYTESRPRGFVVAIYNRELHQWLIYRTLCCSASRIHMHMHTRIHMLIARAVTCIPVSPATKPLIVYMPVRIYTARPSKGNRSIAETCNIDHQIINYLIADRFATSSSIHPASFRRNWGSSTRVRFRAIFDCHMLTTARNYRFICFIYFIYKFIYYSNSNIYELLN